VTMKALVYTLWHVSEPNVSALMTVHLNIPVERRLVSVCLSVYSIYPSLAIFGNSIVLGVVVTRLDLM